MQLQTQELQTAQNEAEELKKELAALRRKLADAKEEGATLRSDLRNAVDALHTRSSEVRMEKKFDLTCNHTPPPTTPSPLLSNPQYQTELNRLQTERNSAQKDAEAHLTLATKHKTKVRLDFLFQN